MQNKELIAQCEQKAQQWLAPAFDEDTRKAVENMLNSDNKDALIESFYKDLEFGTGGLRGIMGSGSNRIVLVGPAWWNGSIVALGHRRTVRTGRPCKKRVVSDEP